MNEVLLILVILLQALDGWTTYQGLQGKAVEWNKIVKAVLDKLGLIPGLILVKGFGVGIALIAYFFAGVYTPWVLGAIFIGYTWVVWNNARVS